MSIIKFQPQSLVKCPPIYGPLLQRRDHPAAKVHRCPRALKVRCKFQPGVWHLREQVELALDPGFAEFRGVLEIFVTEDVDLTDLDVSVSSMPLVSHKKEERA